MTVQNFVSAATGMAVMVALIRGIVRAPQPPSVPPFSAGLRGKWGPGVGNSG